MSWRPRKPETDEYLDQISTQITGNWEAIRDGTGGFILRFQRGSSFPTPSGDGHVFYRNDQDKAYIYDGSTWDHIGRGLSCDDLVDGSTYVKTQNALTDTLKSNYDDAYSERGSQIGGTNLTWSGGNLNVDDKFIRNDGNDISSGKITAAGFDASSQRITSVANPTANQDAATKAWHNANPTAPPNGSVTQAKLATTTGSVSKSGLTVGLDVRIATNATNASYVTIISLANTGGVATNYTLPGGEYGFYPQIYWDFTPDIGYARQRYVTSSGKDHWIFLLYDKVEKRIIASYEAPDHPSYGQGEDESKIPHPFVNYWNKPLPSNLEIILVDNEVVSELRTKRKRNRGILEVINEEYEVDLASNPAYKEREIIELDEWSDKKGEVVKILEDRRKLKRRVVKTLPSCVSYKKLKRK